ncbi:5-hydroxytryptamine receptor-like [Anastrepha ludens]|uniref:5-hydroxytryptamine receptor-like n=1 Tax=Anastrepha ludens TaxID=28586 RepID=UPI0023AFD4EA|nr:5-hydroxytryptamine receptor-like [Anastrepha ludens]XP_053947281.1 5-hydroxytryptamine receptor-like [Anastrepha ludens]
MDYSQLDANINGNINTGNINTNDFLAIFSSTSPTDVAAPTAATAPGGWPGGGGSGNGVAHKQHTAYSAPPTSNSNATSLFTNSSISSSAPPLVSNTTLLNPPLLTVDASSDGGGGQYGLTNLLESTLQGAITTLSPNNYVNDSYYFLNSNFYNSSTSFSGGNYSNQTLTGMAANLSSGNVTEVQWDGRYPSGYTLPQIVIASVIVTVLMIIIVVGNMLVIIAIATEKSLKNIQNWFIASLAVADFFLGLIIMPFSLANELMGYWIFGSWWCDIHSAMDVLLCTASIMNLCLISLDRYWSITKAVDYLKSRTPARAAIMIAAVWIMSALICIPPLLGWKKKMPEGPLPKCAVSGGGVLPFLVSF